MKKIALLVSIFFICSVLWGSDAGKNNYEDYIVIKYLLTNGDYTGAEKIIDNYLKKYPDDPFILAEKAYILKNIKNDYKNALKLIEKAKTIYPEYYYSNYLHASLLFAQYVENKKDTQLADKAVEYLKTSLLDYKDFYNSNYLLGVILSETGKYEESNIYFEYSNRLRETPEAYYNLSFNYKELGDVENELKTYKKILEFNPNNFSIIYNLARAYLKKKDFENALIYLEILFLRNPKNKDISLKYLYALFASGKRDKFLEISEKTDISGSSLLLYARAFVLSTKGRFIEAENLLLQVKDKDLKSSILLADIYYRKQEYYRGYQLLQKIPLQERDTIYYSLLLEMLTGLNLNRKISAVFEHIKGDKTILEKLAVEDCYSILFAFSSLKEVENTRRAASLFYETRQDKLPFLDELVTLLQRFSTGKEIALEKIKFKTNILFIIGLYKNLGSYDKAASLLKQVAPVSVEGPANNLPVREGPKDPAKKNPAHIVTQAAAAPAQGPGNGSAAGENKKDSADKIPDDVFGRVDAIALYLELSDIYFRQKQPGKLEKLLKWLRAAYPGSTAVKNHYAYFLALEGRELEKALKLSAETLAEDAGNIAYLDTYGYILFKMGRSGESFEYLSRAYEAQPFEEDIIEHMVEYYRLKKEYKKIIEIYERAIEAGVDFEDRLKEKLAEIKKLFIS